MSQELTRREDSPVSVLQVIATAAVDERVNVEKLQALLNMQREVSRDKAKADFLEAMARLQPKLPLITKQRRVEIKGVTQSCYAAYEDIDKVIRPLLNDEGFSFAFGSEQTDGKITIWARLSHEGGHSEEARLPLALDTSGNKNNIQAMGSTVSYGRRYLVTMMLNLVTVDEDTDGHLVEPVTLDQINKMRDLILDRGVDETKFCRYMDVDSIESIQQRDFDKAITALKGKKKREE